MGGWVCLGASVNAWAGVVGGSKAQDCSICRGSSGWAWLRNCLKACLDPPPPIFLLPIAPGADVTIASTVQRYDPSADPVLRRQGHRGIALAMSHAVMVQRCAAACCCCCCCCCWAAAVALLRQYCTSNEPTPLC